MSILGSFFIIHTIKIINMFVQAKLILQHYIPDRIIPGMWFLAFQHKNVILYESTAIIDHPEQYEAFVQLNGYPVRPYIYYEGDPNVPESSYLLAGPQQVGWFDEGGHTDEMHDVTMKELNNILEDDGYCQLEIEEHIVHYDDDESFDGWEYQPVEDENGHFIPVLLEGKCTIRYHLHVDDFEDEDDEEEEYDNTCASCNGSGEGQWDGASCSICGGKGVVYNKPDDYEPTDDEYDRYHGND